MPFTSRKFLVLLFLSFVAGIVYYGAPRALSEAGRFLIHNDPPRSADAVVVLNAEVEYHPRLIEAASLYTRGVAARVVINGNRKMDAQRRLEALGYKAGCPWYDERVRVLRFLGVPADRIMIISAEDAYDTMSEARGVAPILLEKGIKRIIVTTSKFHTRRSLHIWNRLYGKELAISIAGAREDGFEPDRWWREGRQIRWVMAEYGAWLFYFKQMAMGGEDSPVTASIVQP